MFLKGLIRRRLPRAALVNGACLALFAGIGIAHVQILGEAWWLLLVLPAAVFALRRHSFPALFLLVVFFLGVGWWRGSVAMRQLAPYARLSMSQVILVGRANADGAYGKHSQTTFGLDHVRAISPLQVHVPGSLSVAGFGAAMVYRGDIVQVRGKLYPPFGGQQGSLSFAKIQVLQHRPSGIDTLRRKFGAGLQSALPEPLASFGLGLLIGQRNTLPADVSQMLLAVGLTHIIAVSGYNVTIIINAMRRLLGKRSKFQTATSCIFLIVLFLAITGNSPSIVRASIISMLSIATWYYGRMIKPVVLLLTAGAITVLANPLYLWGNVSWYLSFLAFYGVVVLGPLVTRRFCGDKEPKLLVAIVIESLCAEAMTLPYVLHVFGQLSFVALPANLLVVAFVPLAMLLCLVAGLAGIFLPMAAGWFAWPAKMLLTYMLDAAKLLSHVPHSFVQHIGFSLAMMLVSYGLVSLGTVAIKRGNQRKYAIITEKKEVIVEGG